jgi:hypothetical protein
VGFAAGIAGLFLNSLRQELNIAHGILPVELYQPDIHYVAGDNFTLTVTFVIVFIYLISAGLFLGGAKEYAGIRWYGSKAGDYVAKFGLGATLINMGVLGFISVGYVLFADVLGQAHLNGPMFAAVYTAVGFGAFGLTPRTFLPTVIGVFIASFIGGGIHAFSGGDPFLIGAVTRVGSLGMLLTAIFSCGMAPVPGVHGFKAGIVVGIFHAVLVPFTGAFHGWMSLYNNALSLSLVVTFLYPLYCRMKGAAWEG